MFFVDPIFDLGTFSDYFNPYPPSCCLKTINSCISCLDLNQLSMDEVVLSIFILSSEKCLSFSTSMFNDFELYMYAFHSSHDDSMCSITDLVDGLQALFAFKFSSIVFLKLKRYSFYLYSMFSVFSSMLFFRYIFVLLNDVFTAGNKVSMKQSLKIQFDLLNSLIMLLPASALALQTDDLTAVGVK